jgi:hypothetical protein
MLFSKIVAFVAIALVAGGVFWGLYGNDLTYDVGSGTNGTYTFSHTEEFSTGGRIILTSIFAILASTLLTGFLFFFQRIMRRSPLFNRRTKITEQCGPDNPRPCGTFGLAPADSAARAGARPKASGGI